jgi:hypothetical protein
MPLFELSTAIINLIRPALLADNLKHPATFAHRMFVLENITTHRFVLSDKAPTKAEVPMPSGAALRFPDARKVMSFVGGHADHVRIYWNGVTGIDGFPALHEPPAGYDYNWLKN